MKIGIIGAGFTGLAAASDLIQAGHQVFLWESASQAGGLAAGFKLPSWDWFLEHFYHHWFTSDQDLLTWLKELNLDNDVIFHHPQTAVYFKNRFYPFDSPQALLRFPGLSSLDKARFAAVTAYLKTAASWQSLEAYTAHSWLNQAYGSKIYRLIWEPLLEGKFGPYYQQVTMAWMWARLKFRTSHLGTYRGGFQALIEALCQHLIGQGVNLKLHSPVTRITRQSSGFSISTAAGKTVVDSLLLTTPPRLTVKLAPFLPDSYLKPLLNQSFLGAIVVIFSLTRPLSPEGYYWYNLPKAAGFPFLALVEHTRFSHPGHFGGDHLVYCGDYLPPGHPHFTLPAADLASLYQKSLIKINPAFKPAWVKNHWYFQTAYAQPVPLVNHSRRLPSIKTPIPNLYLACMAQVYPQDRGTNYAVALGRQAADQILNDL